MLQNLTDRSIGSMKGRAHLSLGVNECEWQGKLGLMGEGRAFVEKQTTGQSAKYVPGGLERPPCCATHAKAPAGFI